jgi:murein DD-endopeptidase MepM/ murein hydrolase activator NlpD
MAGNPVNQWATGVLQGLGIQPSRGALQALEGWARAEGGHTHNGARYNFLNTTQPMPGAGNTGSQGDIKVYKSLGQGVQATVKTLQNGRYDGIIAGLRAGNPSQVAQAIGRSPWAPSASGYGALVAQTIAETTPGKAAPSVSAAAPSLVTPATQTTTTPGVDNSALRQQLINQFLQQGGVKSSNAVLSFASGIRAAQDTPATTTPATMPRPAASSPSTQTHARPGTPVAHLTSEGGAHQTDGLPGYPAHDYFAPSGSAAVAPVTGKVIRLSGHDPAQGPTQGPHGPLGWSVYIQGSDGRTYFMTHMGSRNVKVGQTVRQGQQIGTVADYAKYGTPSHIHLGVNG